VAVALLVYALAEAHGIELSEIEPRQYRPATHTFGWREEDAVTPFNRFHPRMNAFGSRNRFEVSDLKKDLVILLGDSFFFGYGLDDTETIAFFLNTLDKKRKYVNLALCGFNIWDSVAWYQSKYKGLPRPPVWIVIQVLLYNDIFAASHVELEVQRRMERAVKYVLPPFGLVVTRKRLFQYAMKGVVAKIHQDLSDERFRGYIRRPLNRLKAKAQEANAPIMVLVYDDEPLFEPYMGKLAQYCDQNGLHFFRVKELCKGSAFKDRLPDGAHPSGNLNRVLARQILARIDGATPD
jgi:hypothetical protein